MCHSAKRDSATSFGISRRPKTFTVRSFPSFIAFATRRHCLILLKIVQLGYAQRYKYGLKQIGSLRFRFGGMFAHAPCWRANSLIQFASYPRSASNIVCGSMALRRTEHATVIYTPNAAWLIRQHRLDRGPFIIVEFVAHNSRLQFRSLNHVHCRPINPKWPHGVSDLLLARPGRK